MRYRPIEAELLWDAPGMPHLCFMPNPINGRYAAVETVRRPILDGLAALVRGWLGGDRLSGHIQGISAHLAMWTRPAPWDVTFTSRWRQRSGRIEPRTYFADASVDQTEAATVDVTEASEVSTCG